MSKVHDVFTNRDLPLEVTCYILRISDEQLKGGLAMPHAGGLLDVSSLALRGLSGQIRKFHLNYICVFIHKLMCVVGVFLCR